MDTYEPTDFPKKKSPAKIKKPAEKVYQFKIALLESDPPIWRRIQVEDCTLDQLHQQIQTAMGWTNSHPYHFEIDGRFYGNRAIIKERFEDRGYADSTNMKISRILPTTGQRFVFQYEYNFRDAWNHEVRFEGVIRAHSHVKYPLCLEGQRACPPEDCGGIWGYGNFLEAIRNPKHERHAELLEGVGGQFNPEAFEPAQATLAMQKGVLDWTD
jgi:hypothetical protein